MINWSVNDLAARFGTDFNVLTRYNHRGALIGATIGKEVLPSVWNYGPLIQEHFHTHPIYGILVDPVTRSSVSRTTDFAPQRKISDMPLFRDAYKHIGARHQLSLVLKSEHYGVCSLTFARNGSDYSDKQATALVELSKHLGIAMSQLSQLETLRKQLQSSFFSFGVLKNGPHWYHTKTNEDIIERLSQW